MGAARSPRPAKPRPAKPRPGAGTAWRLPTGAFRSLLSAAAAMSPSPAPLPWQQPGYNSNPADGELAENPNTPEHAWRSQASFCTEGEWDAGKIRSMGKGRTSCPHVSRGPVGVPTGRDRVSLQARHLHMLSTRSGVNITPVVVGVTAWSSPPHTTHNHMHQEERPGCWGRRVRATALARGGRRSRQRGVPAPTRVWRMRALGRGGAHCLRQTQPSSTGPSLGAETGGSGATPALDAHEASEGQPVASWSRCPDPRPLFGPPAPWIFGH